MGDELEKKTVPQLREMLRERHLTVGGSKALLIERLTADSKGQKRLAPCKPEGEPPLKKVRKEEKVEEDDSSESGSQGSAGGSQQAEGTSPASTPAKESEESAEDKKEKKDEKEETEESEKKPEEKKDKEKGTDPDTPAAILPKPTAEELAADPTAALTDPSWRAALAGEFNKPYFKDLMAFVAKERDSANVYPPPEDVWAAFNLTPLDSVRVCILGQDPYFNAGEAHGLCFSVRRGVKVPQSLHRIYAELGRCVHGFRKPAHGELSAWARQGVFMLNASLTVREKKPNSHSKAGWQQFTDRVIQVLNERRQGVVYMLWGMFAQKKGAEIDRSKNLVLEAAHPSPMAGTAFTGCAHFSKANEYLVKNGKSPIDWSPDK